MKKQTKQRAASAPVMRRVSPPVVRRFRDMVPEREDTPPAVPAIGHNKPPGHALELERGQEGLAELRAFLLKHTAVKDESAAKLCAGWIERTRTTIEAVEAEEQLRVKPLRTQLNAIYELYREVREPLKTLLKTLRERGTAYAREEERKRELIAAEARRKADEAEAAARAAEQAEADAIARADVGEEQHMPVVTAAIKQADVAFGTFKRASRIADIATRDVKVRIAPTLGRRALAMSTYEVLSVSSLGAAIKAMGMTPAIEEAVLKSAKAYRTEYGELPPGITSTNERRM